MTRTKSSRALLSVVLAVLMAAAFMPSLTYSSFAATAKQATKVTKVYHKQSGRIKVTKGTAWTLKYKLSPSKLTSAAKKVVWKTSDKSIANPVTKGSNSAGVSFKKLGNVNVRVKTVKGGKSAVWKFQVVEKETVKKVAATGVTVAADNTTDYTKTLEAGTTLTATVAPADATGVTYQWYADDQAISGATSQKFKVTTDQIGKAITVKAKANTGDEVTSAASAKVSDVTLTGVGLYKVTNGKTEANPIDATKTYPVGTELNVLGTTLTGASKLSDVAGIKWIRTTYSANGTAQETTIAENTNTYTITKADLAAVQNNAKVTIKAEVTPNANVKTYGTTSGKYTTPAVQLNGDFTVAIQANGKDVTNVKADTKLTAVVTPSDVKVTYQWYKDGKQIAGATSAEYTPTEDGTYRVHAQVANDETTYNKSAHADATVKVGGKTIEKVVVSTTDKKDATPASTLTASALWTNTGVDGTATVTYQWYRNGVKLDGQTAQTLKLGDLKPVVTTSDSFYCVVTGTGDFLSDPVTSNTVKVGTLGEITDSGVVAVYDDVTKTLGAVGLDLDKYNAAVVTVTTNDQNVFASENVVDSSLSNHAQKLNATDTTYIATDTLKDLTDSEASNLYLKLTGINGYSGTKYVKVNRVVTATLNKATATANLYGPLAVSTVKDNAQYSWQAKNAEGKWIDLERVGHDSAQVSVAELKDAGYSAVRVAVTGKNITGTHYSNEITL